MALDLFTRGNSSSSAQKLAFGRLKLDSFAVDRRVGVGLNDCRRYYVHYELYIRFGKTFAERRLIFAPVISGSLVIGGDCDKLAVVHIFVLQS